MDKLQLVVLPGSNPCEQLHGFYEKAYSCWKETWENAAKGIPSLPKKRKSTEFIRQDSIVSVFNEKECVSLGFWSEYDFRVTANRESSSLECWTQGAILSLVREGPKVAICTYLTVAEKYKGRQSLGVSFKDLQMNLLVKRFLDSEASVMGGATRNDKKINEVCLRAGAKYLKRGVFYHGFPTDLVVWHRDAKLWEGVKSLVERLWIKRIDFRNIDPSVEDLYLRLRGDLDLQNPARGVRSFLSSKGS